MNRRRNEPRTHASVFFSLILAAVIIAGGGTLHAFYKNRQVQVSREIDAIDQRIKQSRLETETLKVRMDERLNRFAMRQVIERSGSTLRPIPLGAVEEIDAAAPVRHSVASATP